LDLFVLCCEEEVFEGAEDGVAELVGKERRLRCIIVKDVGDAADCVQNELFVMLNCASVNSLADLFNEALKQLLHTNEYI